ncbi:uncharacterized protein K460DRAFT_423347 [Cucurbitaria berberidis CBS 394.84]|uniref:Uncharacterized protein n=1 Tax=Cucurbitaria berberidis CBS 394.84 TaxID=1168544 RepID=A0A9P4GTK2_9PLEO|nr:uncharacterized protein K460DRAFT_423347 [Cucurbitaria berberidis CBS 394.84]KAF1850811.1 hypothetical protein K460DRAFT_423347 [Cucurbitaria berberidis CBS 394.84]
MISAMTSTVEPSIVHIMVTSTITVPSPQTMVPSQHLQARQWGWLSSAPAWSDPAKPWIPETQPANPPTSVASWVMTEVPTVIVTPTATASPASTHRVLPPSTGEGSNPKDRSDPKETRSHAIIAGMVVGSFAAVGFVGVAITWVVRKCAAHKNKSASVDEENIAGLSGDAGNSRVTSTHTMTSCELAPVRGHSFIDQPRATYYPPQPTHWPPEDVTDRTLH